MDTSKYICVKLEEYELEMGSGVGVRRNVQSVLKDSKDRAGVFSWDSSIYGSLGEVAVAKYYQLYFDGSAGVAKSHNDLMAGNQAIEVKTRLKIDYDLPVRKDDSDTAIFVLVIAIKQYYQLTGWMYGHECKQEKWLKSMKEGYEKSYFVPQSELRHIFTLKEVIQQAKINL